MWQLQAWLGKSTRAEDAAGLQPSESGALGWLQHRPAKSSIGKHAEQTAKMKKVCFLTVK